MGQDANNFILMLRSLDLISNLVGKPLKGFKHGSQRIKLLKLYVL